MSQQNGRPENGRKGKPGEGITRRAGRQGTGAASLSMSIVPHLDHPVNTLSGATLVAEMQRVGQHYQAAVLADDMERAEMCQRHYYALEQLRKVEIRELARQRRQQEIEQALAELEKSGVEIERRISAMEAQHGL